MGSTPRRNSSSNPSSKHGSLGLDAGSVVKGADAARAIKERALRWKTEHFAEGYIEGREFNLALIERDGAVAVLPIAEIVFEGLAAGEPRIVGYDAKWTPDSAAYIGTPRRFGLEADAPELAARLSELARAAWTCFDLAGYARVDFRVDRDGAPFILEVNVNPCLSPDAGFAAAAAQAGLSLCGDDRPHRPKLAWGLASDRLTCQARDMLRIRKVADATTAVNRSAIEAAQKIMREQFPLMPDYDIAKLPDQLANPLKHRFVSRLFVAENARDQTLGVALLLHAPDIGFSYLEIISTALGRTGRGIGATLYERVREEARALGTQLYFESLPDDPELSPNPEIRASNANRLKFYERYGARPIINTAYETPLTPGQSDPPYLLLDPLGSNDLPSRDKLKRSCAPSWSANTGPPADYVQMVVDSIKDDPIHLRERRYTKPIAAQKGVVRAAAEPHIALVLNDDHAIHHVQERGYVEAPVRIRSIMAELNASGLFERVPAKRFSDRYISAPCTTGGSSTTSARPASWPARRSRSTLTCSRRAIRPARRRTRPCSPAITASTPSRRSTRTPISPPARRSIAR